MYVCMYVVLIVCYVMSCVDCCPNMNNDCLVIIVALAHCSGVCVYIHSYVASPHHDSAKLLYGYFFNCIKLMSSCKSEPSQPQLLSPKFFEQPPKLLPPSIFRQACCELEAASNDEHAGSRSAIDESTSKPFWSQHEVARDREGALARSQTESQTSGDNSEPTRKLRSADINETRVKSEKYIQQHHSQSISKKRRLCPAEPKTDQETFNPKYDNQLLLVAENVSYTLAAKQRWKESNHLAVVSGTTASEGKRLDKFLQYSGANVSASTKGQLALELGDRPKVDTPTCVVSVAVHVPAACFSDSTLSTSTKTLSCSYSADSKPTKRPVTESVSSKKDLRGSHDVGVNVPTSSKTSKASFIVRDRTLCPRSTHEPQVTISYSLPVCSVLPGADRSTRNNFNEVDRGFAGEQCLKPRHEKSPPTELNTSSQKPEIPRYHPDLKTKASHPPVAVGERNSTSLVPRMATAIDTDSDLVLAQVLQSEEYEASGECVVRKKERTKPHRVAADCSRDFEIARRLQQELDAESAQSMQSQHHDYRRMPGLGRKLGRCCNLFACILMIGCGYSIHLYGSSHACVIVQVYSCISK